jgi:hypothetical protein
MGVKGLLRHIKPVTQNVHVSCFNGRRAAVDALCWCVRTLAW